MTDSLTEQLLQQYIRKITDSSHICSLLDLFTCSEAKAAINRAPIEDICVNYVQVGDIGGGARLIANDLRQ
jgi:hypothetical protein